MRDDDYYRIRESGTAFSAGSVPSFSVTIVLGAAACGTAAGQSIVLNLFNIVLRFVNSVRVVIWSKDNDLRIKFPYAREGLIETLKCIAEHADPRASVDFIEARTKSNSPLPPGYSIAVGTDAPGLCDLYLSARGFVGISSTHPVEDPGPADALVGAGLASLLGAANVARSITGLDPLILELSGWDFGVHRTAEDGPATWAPLDVGTVRMIGAGAVGTALVYWLSQWGTSGEWQVVDADVIKLKNVSKSLLFSTSESQEVSPPGHNKARGVARWLPNVTPVDAWYDDWDSRVMRAPDVILPLANERGIRARIASDSATVVLHATTSTQWQSSVHRHIAGRDDCIACRFPDQSPVVLRCSTGTLRAANSTTLTRDASLPFVAGAAGLMLAILLKRLELGHLASLDWNYCTWNWRTENRFAVAGRYGCSPGCGMYLPDAIRRTVNARGRWAYLDRPQQ